MKSGIYKILNKANGKFYIGSSYDILKRCKVHVYQLETSQHPNIYLQNNWDKYGSENFEFIVIEYCGEEDLISREQYWLDETKCYEPEIGFNFLKVAGSTLGSKRSEETKIKMSTWQRGRKMSEFAKISMRTSSAMRNKDKWPCDDGEKCQCDPCSNARRHYFKLKARDQRALAKLKNSGASDFIQGIMLG